MNKKKDGKIFGIGLGRTGTTSLAGALEVLGFAVADYPKSPEEIENADAATDIPVAAIYKELDKKYPHSKFILTVRDIDNWLDSARRHAERNPASKRPEFSLSIRRKVFGTVDYDEQIFRKVYEKHIADVREYFYDRPDDLLEMNIWAGEEWEKLCTFLDRPIPNIAFPHENLNSAYGDVYPSNK